MFKKIRHGKSQVDGFYVRFLRIDFYKLVLNLLALALLGFIVWSGIKLFSGQFLSSPLVGSLVFIVELAGFVMLARHITVNAWRPPA